MTVNANLTGTLTTGGLTLGATSITATGTELNYTSGVTSAIQTQINDIIAGVPTPGYATTATGAATTTLTNASAEQQFFTGSTTQTVVMPVTSTLVLGQPFRIVNLSSGIVTVQSSGANTIVAMAANTELQLTVILTSGTDVTSWNYNYKNNNAGITGTGSSVRATSPALVTPALGTVASGVISACTSTSMVMVTPVLGTPTSGVLTNCTGSPTLSQVTFSTTSGIIGTTTNDNAAAGSVGETITASASGVSLTTGTSTNITSISLTAGDWDVWGKTLFTGAASTLGIYFYNGTSSTSAVISGVDYNSMCYAQAGVAIFAGGTDLGFNTPQKRISLSTTTTIYLVANATFNTSTCTGSGTITARRRR